MILDIQLNDLGGIDPNTNEISQKEEQDLNVNVNSKDQTFPQVPVGSNDVNDSAMQAEASEEGKCEVTLCAVFTRKI